MKCVGYDYGFQLDLCAKFPSWIPPPPPKRLQKNAGKKRKEKRVVQEGEEILATSSSRSKGKKRKRSVTPESESGDESESPHARVDEDSMVWDDEEPEEDPEKKVINNIRTRGTKSRPILL